MSNLDEKVRLLLDESNNTTSITTPDLLPNIPVRPRQVRPRSTESVIARLSRGRLVPPQIAPVEQVPKINSKSTEMTRNLQHISKRYPALISARADRMHQRQKAAEDASVSSHQPTLCVESRRLAEQIDWEKFERKSVQKREKLIQEALQRESDECFFTPRVHVGSQRNGHVVDRMMRDSYIRQARLKIQPEEPVSQIPEITPLARNIFSKTNVPPVHKRLYPVALVEEPNPVCTFDEYYTHVVRHVVSSPKCASTTFHTDKYKVDNKTHHLHANRLETVEESPCNEDSRYDYRDASPQHDESLNFGLGDVFAFTNSN